MVLPLIPIAGAIAAELLPQVPAIAKWIFGGDERAERIAQQVVGVAQAVTGAGTAEAAKDALRADPQLMASFQARMRELELAEYKAETERIGIVNETMRAELLSSDAYARRWRPTMGYVFTATWAIGMLLIFGSIAYVSTVQPQYAKEVTSSIGDAIGAMTMMWTMALAVLGISVNSRSRDKQVAAGQQPMGVVEALASRLGRPGL